MEASARSDRTRFYVLTGSLLTGIAIASAVYLLFVPRNRGVTEAAATKMGWANAASFNAAHDAENALFATRSLDEATRGKIKAILAGSDNHAKEEVIIALGVVWGKPVEEKKVVDLLAPFRNDSDPGVRRCVVMCFRKLSSEDAKQELKEVAAHDSSQELREMAQAALAPPTAQNTKPANKDEKE